MKRKTFPELFKQAERHEDYWVAGAILRFSEAVAREMERSGISRTELAYRLGTTPAYVTKILRGSTNFTLATMLRLVGALGVEFSFKLGSSATERTGPGHNGIQTTGQEAAKDQQQGAYHCHGSLDAMFCMSKRLTH